MRHFRRNRNQSSTQFEALESRQLLSASVTVASSGSARFVLGDASLTMVGTLPAGNYTIPEDNASSPNLMATVAWGDGSTSDAILHRAPNGRVEVWAGHAYAAVKTFKLTVYTDTANSAPKPALKKSAVVSLNAQRGRTIHATANQWFNGVVATVQRSSGLPTLATPRSVIDLPPGTQFAQYTVGSQGAIAVVRIDWGDGTVTDGQFVSSGGGYNVMGNHTYLLGSSYRIVVNIIIETPDHTVLHIDTVGSTAHVKAIGLRTFSLPTHFQVNWSDVIPSGATLVVNQGGSGNNPPASSPTTLSGGMTAASGMLTLEHISTGDGTVVLAGNNDSTNSLIHFIVGAGSGSITLGSGSVQFNNTQGSSGGIVSITQGSVTLGGGTSIISNPTNPTPPNGSGMNVIIPVSTGSGLLLMGQIASGLDLGSNLVATFNAAGNFSRAFLSATTGDITTEVALNAQCILVAANGAISVATNAGTLMVNSSAVAATLLGALHTGNLAFNLNATADGVRATVGALPADFTGAIILPPAASAVTLPDLPHAHFLTGPTVPAGTTLYLVNAAGDVATTMSMPA